MEGVWAVMWGSSEQRERENMCHCPWGLMCLWYPVPTVLTLHWSAGQQFSGVARSKFHTLFANRFWSARPRHCTVEHWQSQRNRERQNWNTVEELAKNTLPSCPRHGMICKTVVLWWGSDETDVKMHISITVLHLEHKIKCTSTNVQIMN